MCELSWLSHLSHFSQLKALSQTMIEYNQKVSDEYLVCVICVQGIADPQELQQDTFTRVEEREELGREVQNYESYIQTYKQAIGRYVCTTR